MTSPFPTDPSTYFRKGFGLKSEVQDELAADYDGRIVDYLRSHDYTLVSGDVTIRLAREFGFCYGVERAVEYAYQTRRKFPDRRILLVGEIIHNPHVNDRMRDMGIEILAHPDPTGAFDFSGLTPEDVVIMPAFGVTIDDFSALRALGCILVDTTCGSVLNVWKRVESYARDGFTALIHGKYYHEETRATASQVRKYPDGHYIIVRNMDEALMVCDYIEGRMTARRADVALREGGVAGVRRRACTCSASASRTRRRCWRASRWRSPMWSAMRSLAPAATMRARRRSEASTRFAARRRSARMRCASCCDTGVDVMVVIGGFNSSNTISLAALCAEQVPTYHIETSTAIDPDARSVHFREAAIKHNELEVVDWIPSGPVRVGITAGASTPNNKIGDVVTRILATRGLKAEI